MKINNQIDLIEFPAGSAEEVNVTTEFYKEAFGWQFKKWAETYSDTQDSGLAAGVNGSTSKEQTAPLAVIYVDDIKMMKQKISDLGAEITHDITAFPGGRRFAFKDPAGNQLAVWSDK